MCVCVQAHVLCSQWTGRQATNTRRLFLQTPVVSALMRQGGSPEVCGFAMCLLSSGLFYCFPVFLFFFFYLGWVSTGEMRIGGGAKACGGPWMLPWGFAGLGLPLCCLSSCLPVLHAERLARDLNVSCSLGFLTCVTS